MKKIGLLGGSFDPIHNGHLIISEYLREYLTLDEIWFIPAKIHPLKNNEEVSRPEFRLDMLELAISGNPYFRSCTVELERTGVSYTIDTLRDLKEIYHHLHPEFYFFIGMDNVNELPRWRNPQQILKECHLVAFGRPGFKPSDEVQNYVSDIQFVHVPLLEISSTLIRRRIRTGLSIRYLVPQSVMQYITEKGLYRELGK